MIIRAPTIHSRLSWVTRDSQTPTVKWGTASGQYSFTKQVYCSTFIVDMTQVVKYRLGLSKCGSEYRLCTPCL